MTITTTFRDMPPSAGLQQAAERWVSRLEQVYDRIVDCHVIIERPHRHHLHGSPFQAHIAITVPGANLAVSHQTSKDAYVALADAFRAARRQLLDHVAQRRDFVKPTGGIYAGLAVSKP
jgi:ribosome-associated translation inhibitor RaiA